MQFNRNLIRISSEKFASMRGNKNCAHKKSLNRYYIVAICGSFDLKFKSEIRKKGNLLEDFLYNERIVACTYPALYIFLSQYFFGVKSIRKFIKTPFKYCNTFYQQRPLFNYGYNVFGIDRINFTIK